ncbi:hypothetical protein WNB94_17140 [Aquabacterium sp. A3]|uniref:hypothetical protein n=1 Tax=Aquabacterium sp. A3 TaxID=3132829 RepID=UPI003119E2AA
MSHPNNQFPKQLFALLAISILLPIARIVLLPTNAGGALFLSAVLGALSLSVWIGKAGAAKALGYIFYFLGFIGPLSLILGPIDWPYATFTLIQAAVHLVAARQLLKGEALAKYISTQSAS